MKKKFFVMLGDEALPHCCGVNDVGGFDINYDWDGGTPLSLEENTYTLHAGNMVSSGTGLFTATFVNTEESRRGYEELCREHVLLYQSPVKVNNNSRNKLFLCVFLHKDRKGKGKKEPSVWPSSTEAPIQRAGETLPRW